MRKLIVSLCIFFLLVLSIAFAIILTKEQKQVLKDCHQDCLNEKRSSLSFCKSESGTCLDSCKVSFNECITHIEDVRSSCMGMCENVYELISNFSDNRTQIIEAKRELGECKRTCLLRARESRKNDCNIAPCRQSCSEDKRQCDEYAKGNYSACYIGCFDYVINLEYLVNGTNTTHLPPINQTNQSIDSNHTVEINETIDLNSTEINETQTTNNSCDFGNNHNAGCAAV